MKDITNEILANIGPSDENSGSEQEEENKQPEQAEASGVEQQDSEEQELVKEEVPEVPEETSAQKSWRELRAQADEGKRTKKQLEEAYNLLNMIDKSMKTQQQDKQHNKSEPEEEFNIDMLPDEEYTDNKQLKRILKQQQKNYQKLQKEIESSKKSAYQASVESRIRYEFPDFKDVVSSENVEKLKESRPHIFKSLSYNPDLYEQALGAYEAIKEFGIYKSNKYAREDQQLQNNLNKPRSAASIGHQKKKSALDDIGKYNNPSSEDLKPFYEDAVKKSGRSMSYNS